nr:hypothetical protein OG409_06435 [Streptomyces sp. NBC_00974]
MTGRSPRAPAGRTDGTLSPYGYDAGMTGRYAYYGDSHDACRRGLARLRLALDATGRRPASVSLLPGRSDRILGPAAADPAADEGDGATPPDTDEAFRAYAAALAPGWLTGPRDGIGSSGPVPSSRFA